MKNYQFKFWWEDWGKDFVRVILLVIAVFMLFILGKKYYEVFQNQNTNIEVRQEAKENNKNFAVLNEQISGTNTGKNNYIVVDLFLKKPFISSGDFKNALTQENKEVLDKYNGSHKNKVRAVGYRIYDRKIVYDMGLTPRAIATYALNDSTATDLANNNDETKNQEKMFNKDQLQQAQQNGITTSESPAEASWTETIAYKKPVKYTDYALNVYGFNEYNKNATTQPLSDQEFAFWLKLKLYMRAIGTDEVTPAIKLYLNYDLNGNVDQKHFLAISENFKKLNQRETDMGDKTQYFPNKFLLREYLAIYRPQLLYLIMTGKSVKDYTEAQNKILKTSTGKNFKDAIKKHLSNTANSVDKYGNPTDIYKNDPFVGLTGYNKGSLKKYPNLHNYQFSPVLSENNALYHLLPTDASQSNE